MPFCDSRHIFCRGIIIYLVFVFTCSPARSQELRGTDEEIILNLVNRMNTGQSIPFSDSIIRAFPDLPYPYLGKMRTASENRLLDDIRKERSNEKMTRSPQRVVISASKDLAYVYGSYTVDYDNLEKKHVHRNGSFIIICRKTDGQWSIEVSFNRYDNL